MTRRPKLVIACFAATTSIFALSAAQQVEASTIHFPIACRGPFPQIEFSPQDKTIRVVAGKNATKAGPKGSGLAKSTCAWMDRPLIDAENATILFSYPGTRNPMMVVPMMANCAESEDCTFVVDVRNTGAQMEPRVDKPVIFFRHQ